MKVRATVRRICHQYQDFEFEVNDVENAREVAEGMVISFDWSDVELNWVDFDIHIIDREESTERLVTVIIGDMEFGDSTCLIRNKTHVFLAPISTAGKQAEDYIQGNRASFGCQDYVIPELYEGTILLIN